jgi:hypothetical protein
LAGVALAPKGPSMNECNAQRLVRLGLTTAVGTAVGGQGGESEGSAVRRLDKGFETVGRVQPVALGSAGRGGTHSLKSPRYSNFTDQVY